MVLKTIIIRPEISIVISCLIKSMRGTISTPTFIFSLNHNNFHFHSINDVNLNHLLIITSLTYCFILYIVISTDNNISFTCIVLTILYILL